MKKNIVFQVNIKGKRHKSAFDYSTKSWKNWSSKNNCEVFILDDFVVDESYMKPNWQKWYVYDLLESSNIDYDKICVVDADTIIHPDCPNFFDETGDDFPEGCFREEQTMRGTFTVDELAYCRNSCHSSRESSLSPFLCSDLSPSLSSASSS